MEAVWEPRPGLAQFLMADTTAASTDGGFWRLVAAQSR
jgi:hypothetical protein